jgi:hypothetical protein
LRRLFRSKPEPAAKPEKSIKDILAAAGSFDSLDDPANNPESQPRRQPRPVSSSLSSRLSGIELAGTSPDLTEAAGNTSGATAAGESSTARRRLFGRDRRS